MMNTGAGSDDIDDCVYRAYLMEVDLLHWHVVDLCLGCTQKLEGTDGSRLHWFGQRCGFDQSFYHA